MTFPFIESNNSVQRIDLGYWYRTGEILHPLTELSGEKKFHEVYINLFFAHQHFTSFLPTYCRASFASGKQLMDIIEPYVNSTDTEKAFSDWEISSIAFAAKTFESNLKAELGVAPAYLVTPKGGYNVDILTLASNQVFPPDLIPLVPEAKHDVEQAGKCLAFEVSTAAGFHLHRLNETVVHRYWDAASGGKPRLSVSAVGVYINEMEKLKIGDDKILSSLRQINKLHRNPHTHEENLSVTELTVWQAIELFGIIVSAISAMLEPIKAYQKELSQKASLPVLAAQFS